MTASHRAVLSLALTALLLSGCRAKDAPAPLTVPPSGTTEPSATAIEAETTPSLPEKLYETLPGCPSLYRLPPPGLSQSDLFGPGNCVDFAVRDHLVLLELRRPGKWMSSPTYWLALFDLRTGQTLADQMLGASSRSDIGLLPEGRFYTDTNVLMVYGTDGTILSRTHWLCSRSARRVSADGYAFWLTNGVLYSQPLPDGEKTALPLPRASTDSALLAVRNGVVLYTDVSSVGFTEFRTFDTASGRMTAWPEVSGMTPAGGYFFSQTPDGFRLADPAENRLLVLPETDVQSCTVNGGRLFVRGRDTLHVYREEDGSRIASLSLKGTGYTPLLLDGSAGGALVLLADESGSESLCYWPISDGEAESGGDATVQALSNGSHREVQELSDGIYASYGIRVYTGQPGVTFSLPGYEATPAPKEASVTYLRQLSLWLAAYPDGFFRELTDDFYTSLELYLCDTLRPAASASLGNAAAITTTSRDALLTAIRIGDSGDQRLYLAHEIMHLADFRLRKLLPERDALWDALNPPGFTYAETYRTEGTSYAAPLLTLAGEDAAVAYFVDPYSKTFREEDRARIFEALAGGTAAARFTDAPQLQAKADELLRELRLCFLSFSTFGTTWEVIWEPREP